MWDWKTRQCLHTLVGHVYTVKSLQFDDEKIISGGGTRDKTIKIWYSPFFIYFYYILYFIFYLFYLFSVFFLRDLASGKCTDTIEGHTGGVFTLQYDDEKIVSGATDHTIRSILPSVSAFSLMYSPLTASYF